jgi:hypothetical protein
MMVAAIKPAFLHFNEIGFSFGRTKYGCQTQFTFKLSKQPWQLKMFRIDYLVFRLSNAIQFSGVMTNTLPIEEFVKFDEFQHSFPYSNQIQCLDLFPCTLSKTKRIIWLKQLILNKFTESFCNRLWLISYLTFKKLNKNLR